VEEETKPITVTAAPTGQFGFYFEIGALANESVEANGTWAVTAP
jgi:hypothetical protein